MPQAPFGCASCHRTQPPEGANAIYQTVSLRTPVNKKGPGLQSPGPDGYADGWCVLPVVSHLHRWALTHHLAHDLPPLPQRGITV
jgi:hypothetical protein